MDTRPAALHGSARSAWVLQLLSRPGNPAIRLCPNNRIWRGLGGRNQAMPVSWTARLEVSFMRIQSAIHPSPCSGGVLGPAIQVRGIDARRLKPRAMPHAILALLAFPVRLRVTGSLEPAFLQGLLASKTRACTGVGAHPHLASTAAVVESSAPNGAWARHLYLGARVSLSCVGVRQSTGQRADWRIGEAITSGALTPADHLALWKELERE